MSNDTRPLLARFGAFSDPFFLECDHAGQVVWMSERTRQRLSATGDLAKGLTSLSTYFAGSEHRDLQILNLRLTRVLAMPNSVLISAELFSGTVWTGAADTVSLLRLYSSMLRHIVQLHEVQMRLAARVLRHSTGAGRRIVEQIELERQRLGRELHTGVGQALAAIRLQLELIQTQPPGAPAAQAALDRIGVVTAQALEQVRSVSHRLHPPEWQRLTIADALKQLWELSGIPERFEARLEIAPLSVEPSQTVKVLLYRAAQEAVSNLARHSEATRVAMKLEERGGRIRLAVEDNGRGFDLDRFLQGAVSLRAGIGLRSIREQVHANGGEFRISSGVGGTIVEIELPASVPGEI